MRYKRWFRVLVCLVLVCSLVIYVSPIRAKAVALEVTAGVVSALAALALILAASSGVVIQVSNEKQFQAVGESVLGYLGTHEDNVGYETAMLEAELALLNDFWGGGYFQDNNDPFKLPDKLGKILAYAVAGWLGLAMKTGALDLTTEEEVEVEIPEGYASYNGFIAPYVTLSSFPYKFILYRAISDKYYFYHTEQAGSWTIDGSYYKFICPDGWRYYTLSSDFSDWDYGGRQLPSNSPLIYYKDDVTSLYPDDKFIWASFDICDPSGSLLISASEPITSSYTTTETETVTVPVDVFISDLPQEIIDGTKDEDDIVASWPENLDLSSVIKSPETAVQDIQQTMTELADGSVTYNEYITNITYNDVDINPEETTVTEPTEAPEETTPVTEPSPSTELDDYTLDLRNFFPFCIPFDIYGFLVLLDAEPEAPKFEFKFNFGQYLGTHVMVIDLSQWDDTAQLLRRLELLLFIIGLAMATRNYYIRG